MNPKAKIDVIFQGRYLSPKHQNSVREEVSKRLLLNGCPEGTSIFFYFDDIRRKRGDSGLYIQAVQARDVKVVIRHGSNEGIVGNLKPVNGQMSIEKLAKYLDPVVESNISSLSKKFIEPASKDNKSVQPSKVQKTTSVDYYPKKVWGNDSDFQELVFYGSYYCF